MNTLKYSLFSAELTVKLWLTFLLLFSATVTSFIMISSQSLSWGDGQRGSIIVTLSVKISRYQDGGGQNNGWTERWRCSKSWVDRKVNRQTGEQTKGQKDGQTDGQKGEQTNGQKDGWMDGQTNWDWINILRCVIMSDIGSNLSWPTTTSSPVIKELPHF